MSLHPTTTRRLSALTSIIAGALALASLTACAAETDDEAPVTETPKAADSAWPRTLEIPAGEGGTVTTLTIDEQPERIAALDYESAEVLAELGAADSLVLIPEAVLNPALGGHVEALSTVEGTFPVAMEVDAETVIAFQPDLVIMSPRHGNEAPIADVLKQAGIVSLQLPSSWASSEDLVTNIDLIGQATGHEATAEALIDDLTTGLEAAAGGAPEADAGSAPRVLILTNQAGRPFITAGEAFPVELLERAGADNIADELGIDRTGPISAEQIVQAEANGILLIDMNGTGDRMFTELLENPALQATEALANDRVLRVTGREVQALGLTSTVDGLEALTEWVTALREAA